jgi:pyroglutamyl-peptidase
MKILISGFKPFLNDVVNPSEILVTAISKKYPEIVTVILPVEFSSAFKILYAEIKNTQPEFVIMLGQASGRKNICIEKIGLNWIQTTHPDESGFIPQMGSIDKSQNLALMTKFPVDELYQKLKQQKYPVEISFSAGAYVCNDLYFKILSELPNLKSVFIHVPLLPEQLRPDDNRPTMTLEEMSRTIETILKLIR